MATTRVIATATTTVQQNCAWVQALQFQNTDGLVPPTLTPFDLTGITLTGHFRNTAVPGTPIAAATFTVATPASGIAIAGLSAHDAGLLPAGTGTAFNQLKHIVLEIDGTHASDPNNPFRLAEIDVCVSPGGNSAPTTATAPTTPLGSIALTVGAVSFSPLATPYAQGAMSAAQYNKVEAVTLAQMVEIGTGKLATLASGGWMDKAARMMSLAAPGTTRFIPIDVRNLRATNLVDPDYASITGHAVCQGGGMCAKGSTWTPLTPGNVINNPMAEPWSFRFRAALPVPVNGHTFFCGIGSAWENQCSVVDQYGSGAPHAHSGVGMVQFKNPTVTMFDDVNTIDGLFHDYMLAHDSPNVKLYIDDVLILSVLLNIYTAAVSPGIFASDHYVPITDMAYAV